MNLVSWVIATFIGRSPYPILDGQSSLSQLRRRIHTLKLRDLYLKGQSLVMFSTSTQLWPVAENTVEPTPHGNWPRLFSTLTTCAWYVSCPTVDPRLALAGAYVSVTNILPPLEQSWDWL